ncbi:MAG: ribulose-phosphate 3-epimerase [Bryobacterales bacterium]|nr:ribulose-phosphate 3-epimerase [Bryobacteraceae bacterium]MDW8131974.1 ribulose-phosphate 3-epimerase [Bryobacterales bacterium]
MVLIVPSILSADFARLAEEIRRVEQAGATMLHLDVMDGHFVPNITIGPPVVECIRRATRMTLDVHLMISDPDRYIPAFVEAGADQISVHQEACLHLDRTLRSIRSRGLAAGVVLNPATPVAMLDDVLELVDFVLVMSVNPGFGGQQFIPNALRKIRALDERRRRLGLAFKLEIDGGVNEENLAEVVRAGCDWIVMGASVFGSPDPAGTLARMQEIAREATSVRI